MCCVGYDKDYDTDSNDVAVVDNCHEKNVDDKIDGDKNVVSNADDAYAGGFNFDGNNYHGH